MAAEPSPEALTTRVSSALAAKAEELKLLVISTARRHGLKVNVFMVAIMIM
ncbi:hypothetical protein GCM10027361_41090 [Erwinia aphidicola]